MLRSKIQKKISIISILIVVNSLLLLTYLDTKNKLKYYSSVNDNNVNKIKNYVDRIKDYEYIFKQENIQNADILMCRNNSLIQTVIFETTNIHDLIIYNIANKISIFCSDGKRKTYYVKKTTEKMTKIYASRDKNFTINFNNQTIKLKSYQCENNTSLIGFYISKFEHKIKHICMHTSKLTIENNVSPLYSSINGIYGDKRKNMCGTDEYIYHINFIEHKYGRNIFISDLEIFCEKHLNEKLKYNKVMLHIGNLFDNIEFSNNKKILKCPSCSNGGSVNMFECNNKTSLIGFDIWKSNENVLTGIKFYCG